MKKKWTDYLVVDGYNVINAWANLKKIAETSLEEAREKLNFILEEYASFRGIYTIVVYDAYRVKTTMDRRREKGNLLVIYTKEHQTADSYIEQFITELGPKKHLSIRVATDDMAEQQITLGKGGTRISTRELDIEIRQSREKIASRTELPAGKSTLDERIQGEVLKKLQALRMKK